MGFFLDTAEKILRIAGRPLTAKEIIHKAQELNFLDFSNGKTPFQTIKARVSEDIRKNGEKSRFKRTAKGVFALRTFDLPEYKAHHFEKIIKPQEEVLVFKKSLLTELPFFNGIRKGGKLYLKKLLNPKNTFFIPRIEAETNPEYKQIISYVLIKKQNSLLRFLRGSYSSADSMLKGRYCIGFGGHVQKSDFESAPLFSALDNGYRASIERELYEELRLPYGFITEKRFKTIGIINDDSSDVGKVHFAIVHLLTIDDLKIKQLKDLKGEKSINQLTLIPDNELGNEFESYEYWSKLCIKTFFKKTKLKCQFKKVKNYNLSKHPKVIAIVGAIGSGKTEAARILEKMFGYRLLSTGRILQELMRCDDIKTLGRRKFQDLAYDFMKNKGGFQKLSDKILSLIQIDENNGDKYVIDGIRNITTFFLLKSALKKDLTLIFIESTIDNCFKFYNSREGQTDITEFYDFLNHNVEKEVNKLLTDANIIVYNHGTLKSFEFEIKKFFEEIFVYE